MGRGFDIDEAGVEDILLLLRCIDADADGVGVDLRSGRCGIDIDDAGVLDDAFDAGNFALASILRRLGVDIDADGLGIGEAVAFLTSAEASTSMLP